MCSVIERNFEKRFAVCSFGEAEQKIPLESILKTFNVQEIVRVPGLEYPDHFRVGDTVVHYNLPLPPACRDAKVVLARIEKPGFRLQDGTEQLPRLSLNDVWVADTIRMVDHVDYDEIPHQGFGSAIGGAQKPEEIKALISSRYKETMPDTSIEAIIEQGISVRFFKLLGRVNYSPEMPIQ